MPITSLVLYGSRAREDHKKNSDVDLFAITTDRLYQMTVKNHVNMASYPLALALSRAKEGDLYLRHIIQEGKVIYDTKGDFEEVKESFKFKPSYDFDIKKASDIGWMIIDLSKDAPNYALINRRIAWCVRTILISRLGNLRDPVYSSEELDSRFQGSNILALINLKSENGYIRESIEIFKKFMEKFGFSKPSDQNYTNIFTDSKNNFGLKTIRLLNDASDIYM